MKKNILRLTFLSVICICFQVFFSYAEVCSEQYEPVCGKDGITYFNECIMGYAGVELKFRGDCSGKETISPEDVPGVEEEIIAQEVLNPSKDDENLEDILPQEEIVISEDLIEELEEEIQRLSNESLEESFVEEELQEKNELIQKIRNRKIKNLQCSDLNEDLCEFNFESCITSYDSSWFFFNGDFLGCKSRFETPKFSDAVNECLTIINYVCGDDFKTYPNPCYATNAGVDSVVSGKCEDISCSSYNEASCLEYGHFCDTNYERRFFFFGEKTFMSCEEK